MKLTNKKGNIRSKKIAQEVASDLGLSIVKQSDGGYDLE